MDAD
ncbi:MAG: hypothetical protein EZS28_049872, partial [Streblomastix strix]|jgi:hypothetical protein